MKLFSKYFIAVLAAAMVVASAPSISALIPMISLNFPEVPYLYVNLLTTIPSLSLIFGVLFSSKIESRISRKWTIILGLSLVSFFGTLPVWNHDSFLLLFLSRILLGFGIGLFNRLLIQIIADLFNEQPKKQAKALGLESAFEGLGGIFMTLLIGQLAKIHWSNAFIVYAFGLLGVFLMVLLPNKKTNFSDYNSTVSGKLTSVEKKSMIGFGMLLFLIVIMFINFNLSITPLLIQKGVGDSTSGSNMIAAIAVGAFIAGNLFGKTYDLVGEMILPLAAFLGAIAVFLSLLAKSVIIFLIISAVLGFAFRSIMPYFFYTFSKKGSAAAKFGSTVVLISYNLGVTVAPYIVRFIQFVSSSNEAHVQMVAIGGTFLMIGIGRLITIRIQLK